MVSKTIFNWDFDVPAHAIWKVLADTASFSEAAGFPKHNIEEIPQPDGSVHFIARGKVGPFSLEWDDYPQNWIDKRWFRHLREFRSGSIKSLCATYKVFAKPAGSQSRYAIEIEPANLLGRLALAGGMFGVIQHNFTQLANAAAEFCRHQRATEFELIQAYQPRRETVVLKGFEHSVPFVRIPRSGAYAGRSLTARPVSLAPDIHSK